MTTHGQCRAIIGLVIILIFAVFAAGCGGGGSDGDRPTGGITTEPLAIQAGPVPIEVVSLDRGDGKNRTATLDGSNSTPGATSFRWSFTSKPELSKAELQNDSSITASFVADVVGTYLVELVVTNNGASARDVAVVLVRANAGDDPDGPKWNHPGLASHCVNCHDGNYVYDKDGNVAVTKSGDHIATSNMCQACHTAHTTVGFEIPVFFDHQEIINGICSECHNGVTAIGKSIFHVATNAECDDCHTTTSFVEVGPDGSFDHTGIDRACSACHNGKVARGKHEIHIATETDCGFCHTTESFSPAFADIDHTGPDVVGKRCDSCHGNGAVGQSEVHPVIPDANNDSIADTDCGICHSIRSFDLGGVFNHRVDPAIQRCDSCHNGNHVAAGAREMTDTPTHQNVAQAGTDCWTCHNTEDFQGAYDHSGIVDNCGAESGCHDPASTAGIYAAGETHIPTNGNDCELCHTPGSFTTGVFGHATDDPLRPVTGVCASCHNDTVTAGKPVNHIPTTPDGQECSDCHTSTDTFADATVDHSNINSGCAVCHDGVITTGKPQTTHIPTQDDCSTCHVYPAFATPENQRSYFYNNAHPSITGGCDTCHNGQYAVAPGKPRVHIPTQADCVECHQPTHISFKGQGATFDHSTTTRGCEGCHNDRFTTDTITVTGKPSGHIPTDQDCHFCHETNTFVDAANFAHTGITGNCASCHNGNYVDIGALGAPATPFHIENPNTDCGACHTTSDIATNGVSFKNSFEDHTNLVANCARAGCHDANSTAGIIAANPDLHVQTNADCVLCHVAGSTWTTAVFDHEGYVDNCARSGCHGDGATGKPQGHVTTDQDCSVCHNTTAFAGAKFNHQGIESGCVDCHNGDTAIGKHIDHVPTNDDCYVCHKTTGFIPGTFDHAPNQIGGSCEACHNGRFATGKLDGHVTTTADCDACHNTTGFIPANFDHSGIVSDCDRSGCHGSGATGKPTDHVDTNLDCSACHTTDTFVGGTFDHSEVNAQQDPNCLGCHNGTTATGQPTQGHFDTGGVDCDACHTTTGWGDQGTFDHCPGTTGDRYNACGDYPGDHRAGKAACIDCHTNNDTNVSYPRDPQYAPDCAGCHAGDFRREGDHIGGSNGTVSQNRDCDGNGSGCHRVNAGSF